MAKEYEIKITWEDNDFFQMESKPDGGDWDVLFHMAENTCMLESWPEATTIIINYMKRLMKKIGDELGA